MDHQQFDWGSYLEALMDKEFVAEWHPFPEHYVNTRMPRPVRIPQLSLVDPPVQVVTKLTDDFELLQQYSIDEESIPPKVLCWNDISALSTKMAAKTVKASLEKEYKEHLQDARIEFQSVSYGNHLPFPSYFDDGTNGLLVYHVLDPSLTQKQKLAPTAVSQPKSLVTSFSTSQLHPTKLADQNKNNRMSSAKEPPIHVDFDALKELAVDLEEQATVFILDCSFATRAMNVLKSKTKPFIIFAATSEQLIYNPKLPCDIFTSCMLTPAKLALLWQSQRYGNFKKGLLSECELLNLIELMNNSKCTNDMLLLLQKALVSVADKIAIETFADDMPFFYRIFRNTPFISKLFANYMFAVRVLKSISIVPSSYPELPDMSSNQLWQVFELEIDRVLYTMRESVKPNPLVGRLHSLEKMLEEKMQRIENWLSFPKRNRQIPNEITFLPLLLSNQVFFPRAIMFCARFLEISTKTTEIFLNTYSFPFISQILKQPEQIPLDSIAHFSFVVLSSLLLDRSLIPTIDKYAEFWLNQLHSKSVPLLIATLGCLLLFLNSPSHQELYKQHHIIDRLNELSDSPSTKVRSLASLLLDQMGVLINLPMESVRDEQSPLCRASLLSRITTVMNDPNIDPRYRDELYFDLIASLDDLSPLVREEAIVSLSHALNKENQEFFTNFKKYIKEQKVEYLVHPIIKFLYETLSIIQYEPSIRVIDRGTEFFGFVADKIADKPGKPLQSNLSDSCLRKVAHNEAKHLESSIFASQPMMVKNATLSGQPAISPSGYFACGDLEGRLFCQMKMEGVKGSGSMQVFNYFRSTFDASMISSDFKPLEKIKDSKNLPVVTYNTFIDDYRILSVSNRSQVVVIDANANEDAVCAFWMARPDTCEKSFTDFNNKTFRLLHSTGKSTVSIFDLETQQKFTEVRISPHDECHAIQWLKPYSSLFYVAQNDLYLFDERMKRSLAIIPDVSDFVGCNVSQSMPLYLVMGSTNGNVSLYDMRMMTEVIKRSVGRKIRQFDVHKHLPFGLGISDALISFSYENGMLNPDLHEIGFAPNSFSLHQSEPTCAIRTRNKIESVDIIF